jgi:hypothetical protein
LDKVLKLIKKEPVELPLDGIDFAAIKDQPRRDGDRSRGRGRAERPARGRREAFVETAKTVESTPEAAPVAVAVETSIETVVEPKPRRGRRTRAETAPTTPPAPAAKAEPTVRSAPEPRLRQSDRDGGERSEPRAGAGFGDAVPAFMRRPAF